jgi:O-antigen/teichoic acid export membrane protein
LIFVLIARIWGEENLGQYRTVLAWLAIFQIVSVFGMSEYMSREIGKNPSSGSQYLTHGLLFCLISSLICMGLMAIGGVCLGGPENVKRGIMIAGLSLPFSAWILMCLAVFVALQKIKYVVLVTILESFFMLLLGSAVILKGYGLITLIWCFVIVRLLASFLNLFIIHRYIVALSFQIDRDFFLQLLAPAAAFGLTAVAFIVFMHIDVVILSRVKDMVTVGLYCSAKKLSEICLMLPLAFYVLSLPIAAQGYKSLRESVHQRIEAHTKELFILVFFVFGFGMFFPAAILRFFYGQPFVEATWILRILMLAFLIHSAEMVLGMSCQAAGYHKFAMHVAIFRALSNVVLNFIFIPVWGGLGAASATIVSILFSFVIFQYFVKRTLQGFRWIRIGVKPALACIPAIVLLFPLAERLNALLLGSLYLSGYGFMLLALNGFSPVRAFTSSSR